MKLPGFPQTFGSMTARLIIATGLLAMLSANPAYSAKRRSAGPLELTAVQVPSIKLPAVPPGSFPANVFITFTSSNGPFCLQGFRVDTSTSVATGMGDVGDLRFGLSRIDGNGLSHPYFTLVEGSTGGFAPQDIVVSYGSQICASYKLQFHATEWAAVHGNGVELTLGGTAIVSAGSKNIITAVSGTADQ